MEDGDEHTSPPHSNTSQKHHKHSLKSLPNHHKNPSQVHSQFKPTPTPEKNLAIHLRSPKPNNTSYTEETGDKELAPKYL